MIAQALRMITLVAGGMGIAFLIAAAINRHASTGKWWDR